MREYIKKYCLKCRKNTENINPRVPKASNGKTMLLSKCAICDSKKSRFIKNQEAEGLLSNLGVRTPLSKSLLNRVLGVLCVLTCLRAYVLGVFTRLRANVLGVFTCLRAYVLGVLTCLRAYMLGVLLCLACLRAYMLTCLRACCACVLVMMKFFIFLRVFVLRVLFCLICFTFQYLNLKILTAKKLCALLTSRKNTFYIIRKIEVRNVTGDVVMWFLQKVVFV